MPENKKELLQKIKSNINMNDFLNYEPVIKIVGNSEAIVQNCNGICEYDCNTVSVVSGKRVITFIGCDLELFSLNNDEAIVKGTIMSLNIN